jgi:hypothetical protein
LPPSTAIAPTATRLHRSRPHVHPGGISAPGRAAHPGFQGVIPIQRPREGSQPKSPPTIRIHFPIRPMSHISLIPPIRPAHRVPCRPTRQPSGNALGKRTIGSAPEGPTYRHPSMGRHTQSRSAKPTPGEGAQRPSEKKTVARQAKPHTTRRPLRLRFRSQPRSS